MDNNSTSPPPGDEEVLCCGEPSQCYYAEGCRRPAAPSEPPAEAQQADERRTRLDRCDCGHPARNHELSRYGGCRLCACICLRQAGAEPTAEEFDALAARPSADTELRKMLLGLANDWYNINVGIGLYPEDSAYRNGREDGASACADQLMAALDLIL